MLHQIKLTYGRRLLRLHQYPAYGGGRDHSYHRLLRPAVISVRPPGSGRTDQVRADGVRSSPVRNIKRIVVAFEAGRDGFWLARWLRARDVEVYVIHPTSIAVSREHRRAKTDRLDTELLMRVFLGWLRGERRHCSMVAIPTIEEEDARRPNRERQTLVTEQTRIINQMKAIFSRFGIRSLRPTKRKLAEGLEDLRTAEGTPLPQNTLSELRRHLARLRFVRDQIRAVEQERQRKLAVAPKGADAMVYLIARVPEYKAAARSAPDSGLASDFVAGAK